MCSLRVLYAAVSKRAKIICDCLNIVGMYKYYICGIGSKWRFVIIRQQFSININI